MDLKLIFVISLSSLCFSASANASTQVFAGGDVTCTLANQVVECWGDTYWGQTSVPNDLKNPTQVAVGNRHVCALTDDGVRCWGRNDQITSGIPKNLKNVLQLGSGQNHVCVLTLDYSVHCWGDGVLGETQVPGNLNKPFNLAVGGAISFVWDNDGIKYWGDISGYYNNGFPHNSELIATDISIGPNYVCLLNAGDVECYGSNSFGQCDVPKDLKNVSRIATGSFHTCALTDDGVRCWGDNLFHQLDVPKDLKNPSHIVAGYLHTCALTDDGVRCWGDNSLGQSNVTKKVFF